MEIKYPLQLLTKLHIPETTLLHYAQFIIKSSVKKKLHFLKEGALKMTILKHLFWVAGYTIIFINCLGITMQYFLGLNNIVSKLFGLIDDVNLAAIF